MKIDTSLSLDLGPLARAVAGPAMAVLRHVDAVLADGSVANARSAVRSAERKREMLDALGSTFEELGRSA